MLRNIAAGGLAGAIVAITILMVQGQPFHLAPVGMSYADLAATILAAVAVLTTIIGVFIAALAVWGYTAFRTITKNSAKSHVSQQLRQGELRTHVETVVTEFLSKEFESGNLRRQLEDRLDEILISAPSDRAKEEGTTDSDVPLDDI